MPAETGEPGRSLPIPVAFTTRLAGGSASSSGVDVVGAGGHHVADQAGGQTGALVDLPSVVERRLGQRGADDLLGPVRAYAELVAERRPGPAGAEDERRTAGLGEVVRGQELLQREPGGHRVLGAADQPLAALGDAGDLTERLGQVVAVVEQVARGRVHGHLVRGDQGAPVLRVVADGLHHLAVDRRRRVQRDVVADQGAGGQLQGIGPLREHLPDGRAAGADADEAHVRLGRPRGHPCCSRARCAAAV